MKNNRFNKRSGLLQLGMVVSLGITLCGFEYANADIRAGKIVTGKLESLETEAVVEVVKIKKPEVPKPPVANPNPSILPSPAPAPGPIRISPDPVPDPGINPFPDPVIDPLPGGFGDAEIIDEGPFDPAFLSEFPTYTEFKEIKDKEERRLKTETQLKNNVQSQAKYPRIPLEQGIEGSVYVSFIVNKEGKISDVKVVRGLQEDLDKEAVRAVSKLPVMIPGKQLDKPVNARYTIPVKFKINH